MASEISSKNSMRRALRERGMSEREAEQWLESNWEQTWPLIDAGVMNPEQVLSGASGLNSATETPSFGIDAVREEETTGTATLDDVIDELEEMNLFSTTSIQAVVDGRGGDIQRLIGEGRSAAEIADSLEQEALRIDDAEQDRLIAIGAEPTSPRYLGEGAGQAENIADSLMRQNLEAQYADAAAAQGMELDEWVATVAYTFASNGEQGSIHRELAAQYARGEIDAATMLARGLNPTLLSALPDGGDSILNPIFPAPRPQYQITYTDSSGMSQTLYADQQLMDTTRAIFNEAGDTRGGVLAGTVIGAVHEAIGAPTGYSGELNRFAPIVALRFAQSDGFAQYSRGLAADPGDRDSAPFGVFPSDATGFVSPEQQAADEEEVEEDRGTGFAFGQAVIGSVTPFADRDFGETGEGVRPPGWEPPASSVFAGSADSLFRQTEDTQAPLLDAARAQSFMMTNQWTALMERYGRAELAWVAFQGRADLADVVFQNGGPTSAAMVKEISDLVRNAGGIGTLRGAGLFDPLDPEANQIASGLFEVGGAAGAASRAAASTVTANVPDPDSTREAYRSLYRQLLLAEPSEEQLSAFVGQIESDAMSNASAAAAAVGSAAATSVGNFWQNVGSGETIGEQQAARIIKQYGVDVSSSALAALQNSPMYAKLYANKPGGMDPLEYASKYAQEVGQYLAGGEGASEDFLSAQRRGMMIGGPAGSDVAAANAVFSEEGLGSESVQEKWARAAKTVAEYF